MSAPKGIEHDFPLAPLTTIKTGGNARYFARAGSLGRLEELLAWAGGEGVPIEVVGSGSNMLVPDEGVKALVIKLYGELTGIKFEGEKLTCGGGARLPSVAAKAAANGLSGIEFGINIPGTVGGAVRMNANAYGGELARVLEAVDIVTATGTTRRQSSELGFSYRRSNIDPGQIVARAYFKLDRGEVDDVKQTLLGMREKRRAAQPTGIKTFGSTFKNPDDPRAQGKTAGQLLEAVGAKKITIGGARFSPKHANFVENFDCATTSDVLKLIEQGRALVKDKTGIELETEVHLLGASKTRA